MSADTTPVLVKLGAGLYKYAIIQAAENLCEGYHSPNMFMCFDNIPAVDIKSLGETITQVNKGVYIEYDLLYIDIFNVKSRCPVCRYKWDEANVCPNGHMDISWEGDCIHFTGVMKGVRLSFDPYTQKIKALPDPEEVMEAAREHWKEQDALML